MGQNVTGQIWYFLLCDREGASGSAMVPNTDQKVALCRTIRSCMKEMTPSLNQQVSLYCPWQTGSQRGPLGKLI